MRVLPAHLQVIHRAVVIRAFRRTIGSKYKGFSQCCCGNSHLRTERGERILEYCSDKTLSSMAPTASEKREVVKTQLSQLRTDLRFIHAGVTEEQKMPDPTEIKAIMTKLESLLEFLDPKGSWKVKR